MTQLSAVHLFNHDHGVRYHLMIAQGLMAHPEFNPWFSTPIISLGEAIAPQDQDIEQHMLEADYIFRPNDAHFGIESMDRFMDTHGLWKKIVYYDKQDSPHISELRLHNCAAYIKRSWAIGAERKPRPRPTLPILPMDYGLLNEYFLIPEPATRDINIACAFNNNPGIGWRRYGVVRALLDVKNRLGKVAIGSATSGARRGRRAIYEAREGNLFLEYLRTLKRSRIVFTASPDNHGGDSRTWEALACGALVFKDESGIPSAFPLQHGKHCIIYDSASESSIQEAIEQAVYYLDHDTERLKIARRGYEYARKHHMPVARMDSILNWLRSPDKLLENHVNLSVRDTDTY